MFIHLCQSVHISIDVPFCRAIFLSVLPLVHRQCALRSVRPFIAPSYRPSTGAFSYSSNVSVYFFYKCKTAHKYFISDSLVTKETKYG